MFSREAIANDAALRAFEAAMHRHKCHIQARSIAEKAWLAQQPRADAREARAVMKELLADARNSEAID
jgi:hypothetical protein